MLCDLMKSDLPEIGGKGRGTVLSLLSGPYNKLCDRMTYFETAEDKSVV